VGAGTLSIGTDSYPVTVVHVSKGGGRVSFRRDRQRGGLFIPNAEAKLEHAYRCKDGRYRNEGECLLSFGRRESYLDPSF
jgi:hypothetical protein